MDWKGKLSPAELARLWGERIGGGGGSRLCAYCVLCVWLCPIPEDCHVGSWGSEHRSQGRGMDRVRIRTVSTQREGRECPYRPN